MESAFFALTIALLIWNALAHPGHNVAEEAAERRDFLKRNPHSVRSCAANLQQRGHTAAAVARRQDLARQVRARRSLLTDGRPLAPRDFAQYNTSHASTSGLKFGDDETLFFADNSSCVLQSEVTQGPYYVDGEMIRGNVTEDQAGVPLYLDIQIIDTSTCLPVPAVYMDLWHCNATGVYSGVSANGNGNSNDSSNIDATFLRGIQQTDFNGVVQFETIFPGHYDGRATHIHILTHNSNSSVVRSNATLLQSNFTTHASHVGQLFFDQSLISAVESLSPYNTNTQSTTLNSADSILAEEAEDTDPFVEYVQLSDNLADGILAWISVGIDPTSDQEITSAATFYDDGGVANEDNAMGGGPGGNMTGGAMPSGSMSGGMPSASPAA